jgi:hypothetical protein
MIKYWTQQNVDAPPDELFPFSDALIDEAFAHSKGVPREAIKYLIPQLDSLLFDKPVVEAEPQLDYVIKLTSTVVTNSIIEALTIAGAPLGIEVKLQAMDESSTAQQSSVVQLTKDGVIHSVGVDVPNVKDWDRSGGVAAFYAAKRLKTIIDAGSVEASILAVPVPTKGAKFEALSEDLGSKMLTLRMDTDTATSFVQDTKGGALPHGYAESITGLVDSLFS